MTVETMLSICSAYTSGSHFVCSAAGSVPSQIGLEHITKWANIGYVLFGVGLIGNFYHHILLRNLRSDSKDKQYKQPEGGLFGFVVCPHYFLELIQFTGMAIISGQPMHWAWVLWTLSYFGDRSNATLNWYREKIPNFDKKGVMKRLIPFVY
jgi:steroid 5-alpha reductase family enzyme